MGKTKKIKAADIIAVPKKSPMILAQYKPIPTFRSGCSNCN